MDCDIEIVIEDIAAAIVVVAGNKAAVAADIAFLGNVSSCIYGFLEIDMLFMLITWDIVSILS